SFRTRSRSVIHHLHCTHFRHLTLPFSGAVNGTQRTHESRASRPPLQRFVRQPVLTITTLPTPAPPSNGTAARPQARCVRAALRRWLSHDRRLPHRERGLRGEKACQRLRQRSSPRAQFAVV